MENDQQPAAESAADIAAEGNVMDKVLGTFDGIVDNATSYVGSAATNIRQAGSDLVDNAGEVTGSIGEKAGSAASGVGNVITENFDAAVTFAKGLFGG